ncbi:hypothetical protein [Microbacterium sp.]|uniref:hypothetical protein n=1 Tax=Microbacterium sp. TaxID=51671 RepID=UPI003C772300
MNPEPVIEHPADADALGLWFADVERHQFELNRDAARRAGALAEAIGFARQHPDIYALPGDSDAVTTAERCAVAEAGLRLQLSENTIRNLAHTADAARDRLPALWQAACDGFATLAQIETAVALLARFDTLPAAACMWKRMRRGWRGCIC